MSPLYALRRCDLKWDVPSTSCALSLFLSYPPSLSLLYVSYLTDFMIGIKCKSARGNATTGPIIRQTTKIKCAMTSVILNSPLVTTTM